MSLLFCIMYVAVDACCCGEIVTSAPWYACSGTTHEAVIIDQGLLVNSCRKEQQPD